MRVAPEPLNHLTPAVRSSLQTSFLVIVAVLTTALAVLQWRKGHLNPVFGAAPTPLGERLYTDFSVKDVVRITLSSNDAKATFSRKQGQWMMESPSQDRMDPRWAKALIDFTLSTRAADVIPNEKINNTQAGLTDGMINVRLEDAEGKPCAKYVLGRRTAWMAQDPVSKEEVPTMFIQPRDKGRKTHTYACTGDIRPIFNDGFRYFRDHHPFLFAPSQLEKIHIKSATAEFVLESSSSSGWRLTKPQKIATEPEAMQRLITGLFELCAVKVTDRSAVTLPSGADSSTLQISLQSVGQDDPVVLTVFAPTDDKAPTVRAIVSDRPQTVLELPLRPYNQLIGLSSLPLSNYNELRSQQLMPLNVGELRGIQLQARGAAAVELRREDNQPWQLRLANGELSGEFNEKTLYQLLKLLKETKVEGFLTDSALLTPERSGLEVYGLTQPVLTLKLEFNAQDAVVLQCGLNKEGLCTAHVNLPDSAHTIFQLPSRFLEQMPTRLGQWRDTRLLAISAVDFVGLERELRQQPRLQLQYDYRDEAWQAQVEGVDRSQQLNTARSNRLLETLGDLRVQSWIELQNSEVQRALADAPLKLKLVSRQVNDQGETAGVLTQDLLLGPVGSLESSQFFYGRISTSSDAFIIDRASVLRLAVDLFKETSD